MEKTKKNGAARATKRKKDISESYNRFKQYHGRQYTGMKVGRGHKWNYDPGVWIDKKITPEKWTIRFEAPKRRAGKAPEGSGAPVGTEYHWYILAHQVVKKLDANTYSTSMDGLKFKLAHKRSDKEKWNVSEKTQQKNLIKILKTFIKELEEEPKEKFIPAEPGRVPSKKLAKIKKELAEAI